MSKIIDEYKAFAVKGNMLDMAIGIVVGGAFATIASSLVANVIAPVLGVLTSGVDLADLFLVLREGTAGGPYPTLEQANLDGAVTLGYGLFLNAVFSFIIVSWFAFFLVKGINRIKADETRIVVRSTRNCPYCCSTIALNATRCPQCTSEVEPPAT